MSLFGQADVSNVIWIVILFAMLIGGLIFFAIFARYFRLYVQSVTTGAGIGIFDLLGMTFRKVNPTVMVRSKIMAVQAGLGEATGITSRALEAHYLAGGNVPLVIRAIIAANKAKTIDLSFKLATAIDLAGRNVLEAVQTSVYPKVIDCPPRSSGRESLDAVAKNGIQLKVKARVTVRANLESVDRRRDRGDDHRPRRRRDRQRHRLVRNAHRRAGQSRPHLQGGAGPAARLANRLRDRVDRHRRHRRRRKHRRPAAGRPGRGRHCAWPAPRPRDAVPWPWRKSRK